MNIDNFHILPVSNRCGEGLGGLFSRQAFEGRPESRMKPATAIYSPVLSTAWLFVVFGLLT